MNLFTPYLTPAQQEDQSKEKYKQLWAMMRPTEEHRQWAAKVYVAGQHWGLNNGYMASEERRIDNNEKY